MSFQTPASKRDLQAFSLTRWFAVVALASISVITLALALLLNWFFSDRLMNQQAVLTAEFVNSLMRVERPMLLFVSGPKQPPEPHVRTALSHLAAMPDVLRANVYNRDHEVIWSSDGRLIGRQYQHNPNLEAALRGEVVSQRDDDFIEHGVEEREAPRLEHGIFMETYVPVVDALAGEVVGAIEFYKRPKALQQALQELHVYIAVGGVVCAVLLYMALFGLIRRADLTMQRQQERLLDHEKMAVIGEMSTAVAHGIRNPLASIRSSAELIQVGTPALVEQAVDDVISECDRLEQWVNELLSYARPLHAEQVPVALSPLIQTCLDESRREFARRGIQIETDLPDRLPAVRGNALLIGQVLRSLLSNALEACVNGGRIRVQAELDAGGRRITVTISDNGPGMTAAELRCAGQPFFTTKPRGLGVGLALARRVVERLDGTLEIDSAPGHGTSVHVRMPAHG
ncbi:sensor histidine kinase [Sphaerotilus mobilis]|uniref:histidine kinase n=1 Tax=Sphaerotilus mobilis TaxID=47994 RepID=A0A4Q7LR87_9BURK|nr:ATP-binding protein [Sphaerotilus mobilis]RZS56823.1 phospho-acceptor domain-containing protein [Sphaerotilus mobilis]